MFGCIIDYLILATSLAVLLVGITATPSSISIGNCSIDVSTVLIGVSNNEASLSVMDKPVNHSFYVHVYAYICVCVCVLCCVYSQIPL